MRRRLSGILALGVMTAALGAPAAADALAPLAQSSGSGGIVFVGSSIFHRWTSLARQMAPLPVTNLAFDGAETDDILRLVDSRVLPFRPKVVAYYCGSNDVDAGESAAAIFNRIRQFVDRVTSALPETRVVFVSINRAPEKESRWNVVDEVNRRVDTYAKAKMRVDYVDVNPVLFNHDGTPRLELFMSDQLHLRPQAYEEFTRIIKPVLTKALEFDASK